MRVTIRLFARLRDIAGTAEMFREIAPGATIGAVWHELAGEFPALADSMDVWSVPRIVVNGVPQWDGAVPERVFLDRVLAPVFE